MEVRRGSNFLGIIGTNNTGKSVIARELIKKFNDKRDLLEKNKKYPSNYNKLILYDPQHRFQDLMREGDFNIKLNDKDWEEKILNYRASYVVLDDYKELFRVDTLSDKFMDIMSSRADYGLDITVITWHPKLILPRLAMFIDKYILFKINSDDKEYCSRIEGEKDFVLGMKYALNKEFKKYTEEQYKNLYPNFPFIYYDSGRQIAKKVNFKK